MKLSGGAGNRTRVREAARLTLVHVRSRLNPVGRVRGFGRDLSPTNLDRAIGGSLAQSSPVVDAFWVLGRPSHQTAQRFLTPRERARCRSHLYVQLGKAEQEPPARRRAFRPHVEADRPRRGLESDAQPSSATTARQPAFFSGAFNQAALPGRAWRGSRGCSPKSYGANPRR